MSGYSRGSSLFYIFMLILWSLGAELGVDIFDFDDFGREYAYEYEDYTYENTFVEVDEPDKPAMVRAYLEGDTGNYFVRNTYDIDYISRDVVGMQGVPVEVQGYVYEDIRTEDELELVFVYDDTQLECAEEDLGILWYNETDYWYETLISFETDFENNTVAVPVEHLGTYILEDMKTWESVWNGTYVYEEDELPQEPECHWHNEFHYEDIEALADISMYEADNYATEYHITNIEQLAGLVKLVNEGNSFYGCDFYLDADLDLEGFDWVPIGWYYPSDNGYLWKDFPFEGRFFGNGHAIYNMHIVEPDQSNLGLFGRTLQGFEVHDLALIDCYVEGKFYTGGMVGDNINSGEEFDMTGCFVSGTVKGLKDIGALVGSTAYLKVQDCYAVMEDGSTMELIGDLRKGFMENCSINDEAALKVLEKFE